MLEYIKQDRKLSFNNWRYKILHWAFGVNPKNVDEATKKYDMAPMFYTHYCPLFHLSNLIVIFFPFILFVKVSIYTFANIILPTIVFVHDKGEKYREYRANKQSEKTPSPSNVEKLVKEERKIFIRLMKKHPDASFSGLWDQLWFEVLDKINMPKEDGEKLYEQYREAVQEYHRLKKEKADKRRNNIIFWINFSQIFVKGFLNILYFSLTLFVAWILWSSRHLFVSLAYLFVGSIWNLDVLAALLWMLLTSLKVALVFAVLFGIFKFAGDKITTSLGTGFSIMTSPIYSLKEYIISKLCDFVEFVEMFYEENCPAIQIVSEEEAELT